MAIETSGVYGQRTTDFLKELGHRLRQVSGEANSFQYLAQRLSVAIQRGNSASVMGTMHGNDEEFFCMILETFTNVCFMCLLIYYCIIVKNK